MLQTRTRTSIAAPSLGSVGRGRGLLRAPLWGTERLSPADSGSLLSCSTFVFGKLPSLIINDL